RLLEDQTGGAMPVYQAIWQLTAAERLAEAEQALALALALALAFEDVRRRGSVIGFALASLFHSYLEFARGRVQAAEADAMAARDAADQMDPPWWGAPALAAGLIDFLVEQGRLDEADVFSGGLDGGDSTPQRLLLRSVGWLRLAQSRARLTR